MQLYIGLDVHSKKTVYCCQDQDGKVLKRGSVPTSVKGFEQLIAQAQLPMGTIIGLETGTQSNWVSRLLAGMGMSPVVIEAREVRAKARRIGQKSDGRDAFEICDGLRCGIYHSLVYVPDPEVQRLRTILSRRRHFVNKATGQINAAKFLLRSVGLSDQARTLTSEAAWEKLLSNPTLSELRRYLEMHARMWILCTELVAILDLELRQALGPFKEPVALLTSVPGVGPITAATFVAVLGTPHRFPDSSRLASYIGLVPSSYDSGETIRRGRITKRGSSELRTMLCEAAHHTSKPTHPLNPYFRRVCAKSGYRKAVVCVARRLSGILYQMWRNNEVFDETKLNVVRSVKVKQRTCYYELRQQVANL